MGSGCTSGHGVCGLPRLAARSWVAVTTFMTTGLLAASVVNATPWLREMVFGPHDSAAATEETLTVMPIVTAAAGIALLLEAINRTMNHPVASGKSDEDLSDHHHHNTAHPANLALSWGVGAAFAAALGLSGMANPAKVLGFLTPMHASGWDPSLAFVMGGAVAINAIAFPLIFSSGKPMLGPRWHLPTSSDITPSLVIGAALFGLGWGIGGMCPGPAIVSLASGSSHAVATVVSIAGGMSVHRWMQTMGWA